MASVLSIQGKQVTVEPGISWRKLDQALAAKGLTLRLYPSSYPSSTVGGWLAQGGAGFGSWRYGWFVENVISARAVLGDGRIREFSGRELALLSEAKGITGLISQITLMVRPAQGERVSLAAFDSAMAMGRFISSLAGLELWSISFVTPSWRAWQTKPRCGRTMGTL
jgi:FAD/FMN-containing dehydrogenase